MDKEIINKGKIITNKNILYSIVALATKEISGVVGLSKKTGLFPYALQNKDFHGIKLEFTTNGELTVDVFIDVFSDISAPDLCFKVQENVKNNVLSMVDVVTAKVNVHIVDVIIKEEGYNEGAI